MEFVPLAALGATVFAFVNFLKYLRARDTNAAVTQLIVWIGGAGAVFLFAASQFGSTIKIDGAHTLDQLTFWSRVILGINAASLLTVANEFRKAVDRTDTSVTPSLLPPTPARIVTVPAPPAAPGQV